MKDKIIEKSERGYLIELEDNKVYLQRLGPSTGSGSPLSQSELIITDLCERLLSEPNGVIRNDRIVDKNIHPSTEKESECDENTIIIPIPFKKPVRKENADGSISTTMHMRFSETVVGITDDDGNNVGEVAGCLGGGVELRLNEIKMYASASSIWNALCEKMGKEDLKFIQPPNDKTK